MKIIKKMEIYELGQELFRFQNNTYKPFIVCIARASSITGTLRATSMRQHWSGQPASRIIYDPYFQTNPDGVVYREPDDTEEEDNFTLIPDKPYDEYTPEEKKLYDRKITIPTGTNSISVEVTPRDDVLIIGSIFEEYAIIDDDGNEISLETFLEERDAKLNQTYKRQSTRK